MSESGILTLLNLPSLPVAVGIPLTEIKRPLSKLNKGQHSLILASEWEIPDLISHWEQRKMGNRRLLGNGGWKCPKAQRGTKWRFRSWIQSVPIFHFCLKSSLQNKYVVNFMCFYIHLLALCYLPFCVNLWPPWTPWPPGSSISFIERRSACVVLWFCGLSMCVHQILFCPFCLLVICLWEGFIQF